MCRLAPGEPLTAKGLGLDGHQELVQQGQDRIQFNLFLAVHTRCSVNAGGGRNIDALWQPRAAGIGHGAPDEVWKALQALHSLWPLIATPLSELLHAQLSPAPPNHLQIRAHDVRVMIAV